MLNRKTPLKSSGPIKKTPLKKKPKPHLRKDGTAKRGWTKTGKPSAKTLLNKADQLAGAACRARGFCQACHWEKWRPFKSGMGAGGACWGSISWCHIEGRANKVVRHDPRNCLALCHGCHMYMHKNPSEFAFFVESISPGTHDYLLSEERANILPLYEVYARWIAHYKTQEAA